MSAKQNDVEKIGAHSVYTYSPEGGFDVEIPGGGIMHAESVTFDPNGEFELSNDLQDVYDDHIQTLDQPGCDQSGGSITYSWEDHPDHSRNDGQLMYGGGQVLINNGGYWVPLSSPEECMQVHRSPIQALDGRCPICAERDRKKQECLGEPPNIGTPRKLIVK